MIDLGTPNYTCPDANVPVYDIDIAASSGGVCPGVGVRVENTGATNYIRYGFHGSSFLLRVLQD
jgi:hypothetical protein